MLRAASLTHAIIVRAALLLLVSWVLLPSASFASTGNAATVAVSADGTRVYAGFDGVGFSVFSRDPSTGELTLLGEAPGAPPGGGLFDSAIAVSPDNANLYGVDGQDSLLQYAPTSGGVLEQQSYPVLANTMIAKDPVTVAVSPDGSSVYVLTYGYGLANSVAVTLAARSRPFNATR